MTQPTTPSASRFSELAEPARPLIEAAWRECLQAGSADPSRCVLFFVASNGSERAHVSVGRGKDFDAAWSAGVAAFQRLWQRKGKTPAWLRVEAAHAVRRMEWAELTRRFAMTKRNYWRYGLSFDEDLTLALLPLEMGGNAVLYDGNSPLVTPNGNNLKTYAQRRFGRDLAWPADPAQPMWLFETRAVFSDGEFAHVIEHEGRNHGYRRVPDWGAERVLDIVRRGSGYLARQVKPNGEYHYGWFPCFDRPIPTYNALRHASSTYALLEGWELTGDPAHKAAIDAALDYLCNTLIREADLPDGTRAAFLVDTGDEIKLGGNAVCLLALCKYAELTGDHRHLPLLEKLALGIEHMQKADGSFVHVLNWPALDVKAEHRIIYYDGEAAFGLMRLYGLTRDPRWLAAVEKAFDYFIRAEHWRAHDHWLGYCVNELTLSRPEERYYRFGLDNVRDHLDFVLDRITTFPTLLEMMMAARRMIDRIQADPALAHLLDGFDLDKFQRALEARARYLLTGFFWPELAMFFRNPARILDGFFIKHHAYRVRIDDVEHYLSGYVAYWKYLRERDGAGEAAKPRIAPAREPTERHCALFLHDDLREVGNGIEIAGVRRARLFHERLGATPWILTSAFSPLLRQNEQRLKDAGLLPHEVRVLNLYDWIADMARDGRLRPLAPSAVSAGTRVAAASGLSRRVHEVQGAAGMLRQEQFETEDGRVWLRRESLKRGAAFEPRRILLHSANGGLKAYAKERDFVAAMMAANLDAGACWHMLIDRNRTYRGVLQNGLRGQLRCTVSAMFHSLHLLPDGQCKGSYWYPLHHPDSCDGMVVMTEAQRDDLVSAGVPADRVQVIPHWLDPFPSPLPPADDAAPRAVCFARYAPEKRHEVLFRVFAEVVRAVPQAQLHCYGEGALKRPLREWVAAHGLEGSIFVHDFVRDIDAGYAGASLGVIASQDEGFSLFGLECLARGRPLVAFDVPYGPRDLLRGRDAGVLVEANDEAAMAVAIAGLLGDPVRLQRLRAGALASAGRFTADRAVAGWNEWWTRMQAVADRAGR